jgi:protein-tyrosine phosphatase
MKTILMVCTGNICRSPMAAALLLSRLEEDPAREGWSASSAGMWAVDGHAATDHALTAMSEVGLDISRHRSRRVTRGIIDQAALVLGMTPNHVEGLKAAFPHAESKINLLAEMAGHSHGVDDPYGSALESYRATAAELDSLIDEGYSKIVECAESSDV